MAWMTIKMKENIKKAKLKRNKDLLQSIIKLTNKEKQNLIQINTEKGASSWLTTLPIKIEGFQLDKQSFWDLVKI